MESKNQKLYKCKKCNEEDETKFYNGRLHICKNCYTGKITEQKKKDKEYVEDMKKEISALKDAIEDQNKKIAFILTRI
jgi:septin family protein